MRMTLAIDSASAEEAHAFIAAFQVVKQRHRYLDDKEAPRSTISGPTSWNITLVPLSEYTAGEVLQEFHRILATQGLLEEMPK